MCIGLITANEWNVRSTFNLDLLIYNHDRAHSNTIFLSQGGMVFQANLVNPIPIYLRLHKAPAAIRTLYNDFVACFYPDVNVFTEESGG